MSDVCVWNLHIYKDLSNEVATHIIYYNQVVFVLLDTD